jgi:argininosuccinate lyase
MVRFSESVTFDQRLARYDVAASQAHARMLAHSGLLTDAEAAAICDGLAAVLAEIEAGSFVWQVALEDVHMNIEQALTARVPAAAKLHTARSRNDQVATDMRLFFVDGALRVVAAIETFMGALLDKAADCTAVYIPGYTHLQRAQPVSMAYHLLAYVEMLGRDRVRFQRLADDARVLPLGSGAIAGTTLPIDRAFTARQLGFVDGAGEPRLTHNSMDAVADRDLFVEFTAHCALLGVHLSRLAEDLILWSTPEFGFVRLPDAYTTGSSLMPQKKNPDAMELIRGKAARLCGHASALLTMVKGLPLTYNRDLQEDKPPVFDALDTVVDCLAVAAGTVGGMEPQLARCAAAVADPALLATDLVDFLVLKGKPFREAHHVVGALVGLAEQHGVALNQLADDAVAAVDPLLTPDWRTVFDLGRAMAMRERVGMPGPRQTESEIERWRALIGG